METKNQTPKRVEHLSIADGNNSTTTEKTSISEVQFSPYGNALQLSTEKPSLAEEIKILIRKLWD